MKIPTFNKPYTVKDVVVTIYAWVFFAMGISLTLFLAAYTLEYFFKTIVPNSWFIIAAILLVSTFLAAAFDTDRGYF